MAHLGRETYLYVGDPEHIRSITENTTDIAVILNRANDQRRLPEGLNFTRTEHGIATVSVVTPNEATDKNAIVGAAFDREGTLIAESHSEASAWFRDTYPNSLTCGHIRVAAGALALDPELEHVLGSTSFVMLGSWFPERAVRMAHAGLVGEAGAPIVNPRTDAIGQQILQSFFDEGHGFENETLIAAAQQIVRLDVPSAACTT